MKRYSENAIRQLTLDLNLDDGDIMPPETPTDVQRRLHAARAAFLVAGNQYEWFADYQHLVGLDVPHKIAMYIAWASCPRDRRSPKTMNELANLIGLHSARVIYTWKQKNEGIDELVKLIQAKPLFEHRRLIYDALIEVATQADYKSHNDRKLALEMLGDYVPRQMVDAGIGIGISADDLAEMSEKAKTDVSDYEAATLADGWKLDEEPEA